MTVEPDTISLSEVARRLGVDRNTVRRHIQAGKIPGTQLGARIIIPRRLYDAWWQQIEREAGDRWQADGAAERAVSTSAPETTDGSRHGPFQVVDGGRGQPRPAKKQRTSSANSKRRLPLADSF